MAYPDNLLVQGERVIVTKRPHWKVLILPTIFFIVIIGAGAALAAWLNSGDWEYKSTALWVIVVAAVIALVVLVLVPFIRWRTEHFVITNHHVFFRSGLLSRREHQIPLGQIANMETEVTFWGRLMGYGSLIVESSADQPLKFRNVASLSKVQAQLNQLIRDEREATHHRDREDQPSGGSAQAPPPQDAQQQGPQQQGYPQQGYAQSAHQQAPPTQAYPPQSYSAPGGYPQQGSPQQGSPQQGSPQQNGPQQNGPQLGYPQQGGPQQGYPAQGGPQQGYPPQGYPAQGSYPQHGYPPAGDSQEYAQPGHQPTQAYQQPPGYPPAGTQETPQPQQSAPKAQLRPPAATPAPPSGPEQGEGRAAPQS